MLNFLLLIFIAFISFTFYSTILCTPKSKKQQKVDKTTASMDDPPSKKCNTKGGLLADDPDLKSLKMKAKEQQKAAQSAITATEKPSTQEGTTDLRTFDEKGKNKDRTQTAVKALEQQTMSAYANKTGVNQDGMSMLAMAKVDKEKLPTKMAPKEPEVVAQDPTQTDDSAKNSKTKSHTGNKSSSKKAKSQHGGAADGNKKKKNLEDLLDAMMDKTQSSVKNAAAATPTNQTRTSLTGSPAPKASTPEAKTQVATKVAEVTPAAPKTKVAEVKTKVAEVKTQVPTKVLDVESGRSEKNKKTKKTQYSNENDKKRSADAIKKVKTPSKRR